MAEINDLSVTDASNTARFAENQAPSSLNDGARALEGLIARWHKDTNASIAAGGTGDAITVSANQTLSAYYDGLVIAFNAANANTGATTLNVDSVGAKKVLKNFNTALVANDIKAGQKVIVIYDSDGDSSAGAWQMITHLGNAALTQTTTDTLYLKQGKHTIWVPATAMIAATTSGPASAQLETSSNKQNYKVLDFDASADEYAHFNIAFPKGWNEGTITFQVFWSSTATDTDGVAWGLEAVAVSDNEAIDASWGTAVVVTDDAQSAAGEVYVTAESSAVTVGGTPAAGDIVFFRLSRDVSDANDDMTEDARLIGVKVFLTYDAGDDT